MPSAKPHLSLPKYQPHIDGLRAIAVLSVVAFHAFPTWASGGFIGVDIFFVISGFLISTIIFENLDRGTFSFLQFYARRIRRIFPAFLLVLIASYALGWFALLADEYRQLGKHIAGGAGFASNFVLWKEAGYFDNAADTKPLLHLWSLGVEEQFYLIWPFLLWLAWRCKLNLLALTVLVATASFYLNLGGVEKDRVGTFYSVQTRLWELLCGCLLAWLALHKNGMFTSFTSKLDAWLSFAGHPERPDLSRALSNLSSIVGLFLLVYGFFRIDKDIGFPGIWAIVPVSGAMLILCAGHKAWVNRTVLSSKIAVWFGLISFPLYLWHWPLLSFARIVDGEVPTLNIRLAAVVLAVALAWLTYETVERPIREGGRGTVKVWVLAMLMLVVGYVGYDTYTRDGLSFRIKGTVALNELIANPLPPVEGFECTKHISEFKELAFDLGCKLTKDELPAVMFVGDSHTAHFRNAVWKRFASRSVLMVAEASCLPFSGSHFTAGDCAKKHKAVLSYLEKSSTVKTVILSGYWAYLMSGGFERTGTNWRKPKPLDDGESRTFKTNAHAFLSRVLESGKQVLLMQNIPELDFDIKSCFDNRPLRITPPVKLKRDCSMNERSFVERLAPYDAVVDGILSSFPTVKTYNPRPLFCQSGRCVGSNGALPYYFDGDHVNQFGADLVIAGLINELELFK